MIDDRIATVMQWLTPSEKRKWVARAVDSSVWHRGATAEEAMVAALGDVTPPPPAVDDVSDLF